MALPALPGRPPSSRLAGVEIIRHIVITGASRGIGAALALHYAKPGIRLTLTARSREALLQVAEACRSQGAVVEAYIVDVADGDGMSVAMLSAQVLQPIDLLIANAGVGGAEAVAGPAGETPEAARSIASINFLGVVNTVSPLLAGMAAQGYGQIVIIGSLAGHVPLPSSPTYSAAKAGARAYAIALDRLLRTSGVRVSTVSPGFVETQMSAGLGMDLPHLVSIRTAVKRIADGIAKNKRDIVFPWQLWIAARILSILPDRLLVKVVAQSQKKMLK